MFLAGNSAGAVAVLGAAYYPTQSMINEIFPKASGSSITMQQTLGNADIDYYYGDYQYDYFPKIKGILNLWGGVTLPKSVTSYAGAQAFFDGNNNKPPVISFFGENDKVVWPEIEPKYFSPDIDHPTPTTTSSHMQYNTANNTYNECVGVNFQLNTVWSSWDVSRWGSYSFSKNILGPLSVPWEHYQDCQMGHGLDDDDFDCPGGDCNFKSDFGTGYTDQKTVYLYIAQRAANFFQMILAGTVSSLSKQEFIECKNNRNSCSTANDYQNNCCTDCSSTTTGDKCNNSRN